MPPVARLPHAYSNSYADRGTVPVIGFSECYELLKFKEYRTKVTDL